MPIDVDIKVFITISLPLAEWFPGFMQALDPIGMICAHILYVWQHVALKKTASAQTLLPLWW